MPEIRAATTADIDAVLSVWRGADAPASHASDAEGVGALIARDAGALLLAEEDGRVVGTLVAAWDGWRAGFYRLAVLPSHRRRGIALQLVEAGERRVRDLGARRLAAVVLTDNDPATAFWATVGFERQADTTRFVKNLD